MIAPAGPRDLALLLLLAALWGGSYMLIKLALPTVPPVSIAAARVVLGAAVLWAVMRLQGKALPRGLAAWRPFIFLALVSNVIPWTLIAWGELRIDSALAAILTGIVPLATVVLAHGFTRDEKLTPAKLLGVALGIAGLGVLVGADALAGLGADVAAQLAVAAAALCYAVSTVYARRLVDVPPVVTSAATLIAATVFMAPASLMVDAPWTLAPDATALLALAVLGIPATAGGMLIFFTLIRNAGATVASLVNYMIPLMGVFWGWLVLDEGLTLQAGLALALILAGVAAINRRAS